MRGVGGLDGWCFAHLSDRFRWRMPFLVGSQLLTLTGFAVIYSRTEKLNENVGVAYFSLFLICAGTYPSPPGVSSWTSENLAGPVKRAMGLEYMISMGNLSGFGGSYIFIRTEAPKYPTGYGLALGFSCIAIVCSLLPELVYSIKNKRRSKMTRNEIIVKYTKDHREDLGNCSPLFRYQL
ncbi:hypothetical protein LTR93_011927 [Exophiala xenobiotica]|nr:hypothetical protein LTR93_011927 [Exophiala xenobiotica]